MDSTKMDCREQRIREPRSSVKLSRAKRFSIRILNRGYPLRARNPKLLRRGFLEERTPF